MFREYLYIGIQALQSVLWFLSRSTGLSRYNCYFIGPSFPITTVNIPYNPMRIGLYIFNNSGVANFLIQFPSIDQSINIFGTMDEKPYTFDYATYGELAFENVVVTHSGGLDVFILERIKIK